MNLVDIQGSEETADVGATAKEIKKAKKLKKRKLEESQNEESPKKKKKEKSPDNSINDEASETPKKKKKKQKLEMDLNGDDVSEKKESVTKNSEDIDTEKSKKKKKKEKNNNISVVISQDEEIKKDISVMNGNHNGTPEVKNKAPLVTGITTTPDQEQRLKGDFSNFEMSDSRISKLKAMGIEYLFPIQAATFDLIKAGKDVIGQARTGTGKTLAFALPLVGKLEANNTRKHGRKPKVLVLVPTRELATQVANYFSSISDGLNVITVYGGTPYHTQQTQLRSGVDVVVGTPGRINDLIEKGSLDLMDLEHVILDEVDRMLDMGFADIVDSILQTRFKEDKDSNPQTLLFSATLPGWVHKTAEKYMRDSLTVDLVGKDRVKTATTVQHLAIRCNREARTAVLGDVLQVYSGNHGRAMIFCQTKAHADELAVSSAIKQEVHVMHGDIPQEKREMVLQKFREGRYKCLITTDVAARGLDIPEVDLVIQCMPPKDVDSYIHRSGRTGRANRQGTCVLFYTPREEESITWVEWKAGIKFKRIGAPTPGDIIESAAEDAARSLGEVSENTLQYFKSSAEKLIAERGGVEALSAALAVISGSTDIKSRSLLCSKEGFTTWHFKTTSEMRFITYAWKGLERWLPNEVRDKIQGMRFVKDRQGVVFDLPSAMDAVVDDHWQDGNFDTLIKATELPELLETQSSGSRGGGYGGRGRGSYGGRGGGFRGYGGNSRGGGGRGRGFGGRGRGKY